MGKNKSDTAFNELKTIIKAGAPIVEVVSYEIQLVHGFINCNVGRNLKTLKF